jgi:hypothetical protein
MPIVAHIVCDGCQAVKKDTNHWYAISVENNSLCIKPLALPADWATKNFPDSSVQYFCGRFCAVDALTRWMNKLSDETEVFPFPMNAKGAPIESPLFEENSEERSPRPDRDSRSRLQGSRNRSLLES